MRDSISDLCKEITSGVLPLLLPTQNNLARIDPGIDCFCLNPTSTDPHMLEKFTFLGYFLGWSLRNKGGLAIDLPLCLWRRILKGSQGYTYTLNDLHEMDVYRAEMLTTMRYDASQQESDELFAELYSDFTFTAYFGTNADNE